MVLDVDGWNLSNAPETLPSGKQQTSDGRTEEDAAILEEATNVPLSSRSPIVANDADSAQRQELKVTFVLFLLFVFLAFARPEDISPFIGSLRLTLSFGSLAGVTLLLALLRQRPRLRWSGELLLVLLLTLWFIVGVPFAFWRGGSLKLLTDLWFRTVLFFFLVTQTLTTVRRVEKTIWVVLWSELLVSGASFFLSGTNVFGGEGRMSGINQGLLGWNFLGITVSATLPFIAYLYVSRRSAIRSILLAAVVGTTMWMLVLTASRGGILQVALSFFLSWWLILHGTPRGRLVVVLMGVLLVVALVKAPAVFWIRIATIYDNSAATDDLAASAQESTEGRKLLFDESLQETLEHPVFGLGVGNFRVFNGMLGTKTSWYGTHNTFTQISSEAGIPGLLLLIALLVVMMRHMWRMSERISDDAPDPRLRLLARATLISTVTFIFSGFFASLGYDYLLYFIAGISAALWTMTQQTRQPACQDMLRIR